MVFLKTPTGVYLSVIYFCEYALLQPFVVRAQLARQQLRRYQDVMISPWNCSLSGLQETARVLFQNAECFRRFGAPNTAEDFGRAVQCLPLEDQISRRKWVLQIAQVLIVLHGPSNFGVVSGQCQFDTNPRS